MTQFNGDYLKELRKKSGLSQVQAGKVAGVAGPTIGTWERGVSTPPGPAVKTLAEYFGVDSAAFWIDPTARAHDFTIKTQGDLLRVIRALVDAGAHIDKVRPAAVTLTLATTNQQTKDALESLGMLLGMQHSGVGVNENKDGVAVPSTWGKVIDAWMDRNLPELDKLPLTGAEPPAGEE